MSNTINTNSTSEFYSSIFGAGNNNNSTASSSASFLSDYASIRNGSYGKLLKSYYSKKSSSKTTDKSDSSSDEKTKLTKMKSASSDLSSAAAKLHNDRDLFKIKDITKTDENGNKVTTRGYDRDEINKRVTDFVNSYNEMIKASDDVDDTKALRPVLSATQRTSSNSKLLAKVGINIKSDNTLEIDENKLKEASIGDLQTLFSGYGSYGYWVGSKASSVSNYASTQLSDSSLYTSKATTYQENNKSIMEDYL